MQTIKSKLQLSLQNWDFNTLENYYELLVKNNKNHMDYIVYLYETGQIKKIKKILNSSQNEPNWWVSDKINISYENLVSIINSKEMVNLSDVSIGCFAC
ncbi:capsular biosynthesis protein, partial [Campylobacter jejuni]|nr:capsular biosynthesis protein [Campylobacter jejuni]